MRNVINAALAALGSPPSPGLVLLGGPDVSGPADCESGSTVGASCTVEVPVVVEEIEEVEDDDELAMTAKDVGTTDVVSVRDDEPPGRVEVTETVLVEVRVEVDVDVADGAPAMEDEAGGTPPDDWGSLGTASGAFASSSFSSSSSSSPSGPSGESGDSCPGREALESGLSGLSGLAGSSGSPTACLLNLLTLLGTYSDNCNAWGAGLRTLKESGMSESLVELRNKLTQRTPESQKNRSY
jgi:hypothetical protein